MKKQLLALCIASTISMPALADQSVEVLHWWTAGSEAAALNVLKTNLEKQGITWNDMPVAGGSGEAAMTTVRTRVISGNPPTAVQMQGFDITNWANEGVLADINDIATAGNWDTVVPTAIQAFSKHDGKWVAAPVNVHSTNWVWANKAVMDKAGITEVPETWDDFIKAAEKVQAAGFIALAHGGQPWQDATLFDGVALSTGGVEYYRKAFVELDQDTLKSATTEEVFKRMAQLRQLVDKDFSGRDWNVASGMVINEQAAFQIMGDWAKGEFISAGKVPNQDFLCFRLPGTQGAITYNADQFVMFKVGDEFVDAQKKFAAAVMDPSFQIAFNKVKGSVPARTDISDSEFDDCAKKAMKDLVEANTNNTLLGSIAHAHAVPPSIKNAFFDVITRHFNGQIDDKTAVEEMAMAAQ
ncbi:ABC transporter substrate-binding protein [Thorsellia anophelis]|uniref:Probable sugar-binding periplasmic protein n=1 Tax=Thorsellia anophelis DSM 18579 TaxID=1123402 RepID=A0A1H9ZX10_9GAMM|nr:ABC transporter substrate-binding protein [Thorsellia anophelis]SES86296.1 glucose/mannose transport system substrate-binding protein [Thorsellia anophelis DSM 18579]